MAAMLMSQASLVGWTFFFYKNILFLQKMSEKALWKGLVESLRLFSRQNKDIDQTPFFNCVFVEPEEIEVC